MVGEKLSPTKKLKIKQNITPIIKTTKKEN